MAFQGFQGMDSMPNAYDDALSSTSEDNGDFIGYNANNITNLGESVSLFMSGVTGDINAYINTDIVKEIAKRWYAEEAVEYITNLCNKVNEMGDTIADALVSFHDTIGEAATAWVRSTSKDGTSNFSLGGFTLSHVQIDATPVSAMTEDGSVGIYYNSMLGFIGELPNIEKNLKDRIKYEAKTVSAKTAFIGGGQSAAVDKCFNTIVDCITDFFSFISTGENSLESVVTTAKDKYQKQAEAVNNAVNISRPDTISAS